MRHYLVVANETLDSPALEEWLVRRMAAESIHVHLVVPPNRTEGRIHWHEEEANERARRRLARARHRLRSLGALVAGEVGPEDPVARTRHLRAGHCCLFEAGRIRGKWG